MTTVNTATQRLYSDSTNPGLSEAGVSVGNFWLNTISGDLFSCMNDTIGAQVWSKYTFTLEQQTWMPVITGSTIPGTGTYTTQAGYYTRIGNMIFLQLRVVWTAHTGTGNMTVTGLPFACRNSSNYIPDGICNSSDVALPGGSDKTPLCSIQPGTSVLDIFVPAHSGPNNPIQMDGSGTLNISINYLT